MTRFFLLFLDRSWFLHARGIGIYTSIETLSGASQIAGQRRLGSRPRLLGGYAPFDPRADARWSRAGTEQTPWMDTNVAGVRVALFRGPRQLSLVRAVRQKVERSSNEAVRRHLARRMHM